MIFSSRSGQIGVIILLMMIVMLTIGLSILMRSSRDVKLATQESESSQVFSAAEVGLEKVLSFDLSDLDYNNETDIATLKDTVSSGVTNFKYDLTVKRQHELAVKSLPQGASAEIDLTGATSDIDISWGTESCTPPLSRASILVSVYGSSSSGQSWVTHQIYAGCDRKDTDGVYDTTTADLNNDPQGLMRNVNIALSPEAKMVRIKALYADTAIRVTGTNLPFQSYVIQATGTSELGTETRRVQLDQTLPVAPSVLDYVLLSGTTINK